MELRQLLKKLWSARLFIVMGSVILTLATYMISLSLPVNYRSSLNLYVSRRIQEPSDKYYTFDGYYSQQAAERYTQTVIGILQSREVLRGAAASASLPIDEVFLKQLSRAVRVREDAPQLISLMVTRPNREQSAALNLGLANAAIGKLTTLNQTGDRDLTIEEVSANPIVEVLPPMPLLNSLLAFIFGLVVFSLFTGLFSYLKE